MAEEQQRDTLKATLESLFCRNHKLHYITMWHSVWSMFIWCGAQDLLLFFHFFIFFSVQLLSVLLGVFSSRHNGQWPPTLKNFYTRSYPLHYLLILILEKEPVFPFSMLSTKQGYYWYHFYNVFGMTLSLTGYWTRDLPHSKPALYH